MGFLYRPLERLFGSNLAEHLRGWWENSYSEANRFDIVGLIMLGVVAAFCLTYYFWINHPRFNRWLSWLVMLLGAAFINLGIAIVISTRGRISPDLVEHISFINHLGFGAANFILSVVFFILGSLACLYWIKLTNLGGYNCKYSPFKL